MLFKHRFRRIRQLPGLKLAASRMKKRNTAMNTLKKPRPYKVWKEHFIEDRGCDRKRLCSEVLVSAIPHVLLNILFVGYLYLGVPLFQMVDPGIPTDSVGHTLFFCFITIATIGYGNEAPTSDAGKTACIAYCFIGVPLLFMVLANNGQFIVDAYWIFRNSYMRGTEEWDGEMPMRVTFYLLAIHTVLGGFLFSCWIHPEMTFFDSIYLSFISIATIGFGDLIAAPKDDLQTFVTILYLSVGIIYLTTLTGSLSGYLQKLHYMGRQFSGVSDVEVWFGGEAMTVREVITMVAEEFDTSPELLHYVLNDLDNILEVALSKDTEEAVAHLRMQEVHAKNQSLVLVENGICPGNRMRKVTLSRMTADFSTPSNSQSSEEEETPCTSVVVTPLLSEPPTSPLRPASPAGFIRSSHSSGKSRTSTPISKVPSNSSIHDAVRRDSSKSLHALGIVYHTIQKRESVRRSLSFRKHTSATVENKRSLLPAYPAVV